MEIKINKKGDGYEIEFLEISKTIMRLISSELKNLKEVEEAVVLKVHPLYDNPKVWIKLKEGKPKEALKNAIDNLIEKLEQVKNFLIESK
ncbi:MAG: RpoL/Rpb11 RNA polymerase subunit family protein [Candidatus Aenigmatarchaeota archaeon]